jgi:hypothetical protein
MATNDKLTKFTTKCKVLGYLSKMPIYEDKYAHLLNQLKMEQVQLINDNLINIDVNVLKKIVLPIHQNPWYIIGISNYEHIQSNIINYYNKNINEFVNTELNNKKKCFELLQEIIGIDKYYNIYEDTIEYSTNTNKQFKKMIQKDFNQYLYL